MRYQEIDGFGAAITGSTAYNLSLMPAEARHQFLQETFAPDKFGFSYAMAHMSVAAKPGAYRIATNEHAGEGLTYAAFINPDGSYGLVVSNRGEARQVNVKLNGDAAFVADLPEKAVVSYRWR